MSSEFPVYVFGYGSLMNPESAARTLQRLPSREELVPARLPGWQRKWQIAGSGLLGEEEEPRTLVFLDIVPAEEGRVMNGILLRVENEEELGRLDQRERHYNRIDVSEVIRPPMEGTVYTYTGKPERTNPPEDAMVMAAYERVVEEALELWGADFALEYEASTIPHSFARHDGTYRWDPRGR